jgi:hypothetical protein
MGTQWKDGYSAQVDLYLHVDGKRLRLAQVGPQFLILRDQCIIPAGALAKIVIGVDGKEEEHDVVLHKGAVAGVEKVEFSHAPRQAESSLRSNLAHPSPSDFRSPTSDNVRSV